MKFPCLFLFTALGALTASATAASIDSADKYAWGASAGWVNMAPTGGGVSVNADWLSGYAWAENIGWVKLGSDGGGPYANTGAGNWGVNMDATGKLSGYAWSASAGWINFHPSGSQVVIDLATGQFSGYAWGENIGWVHFASTTYQTTASATDSDSDGMSDLYELANGLDPADATGVNGASGDLDGDGFTNLEEYTAGSAANKGGSNAGLLSLSAASYSVVEGQSLTVTATRSGGSSGAVSVACTTSGGTAAAGRYADIEDTLTWADGESGSKSCSAIATTDGPAYTPGQTFYVGLSGPSGAHLGSPSDATVTLIENTASAASTNLSILPTVVRLGPVALGSSSSPYTLTVSNTGSSDRALGTASLGGDYASEFALSSDGCSGQTLGAGTSCTVDVSWTPSVSGSRWAAVSVPTNDPFAPSLTAYVTNAEGIGEEARRRMPAVISAMSLPGSPTPGQTYTLSWTLTGYAASYQSLVAIFDCTGLADYTCGDNYGSSARIAASGTLSASAVTSGSWIYNGVSSKAFTFTYDFTVPSSYTSTTPLVLRFYGRDGEAQLAGERGVSLMVPGNLGLSYYGVDGRRVTINVEPTP